MTETERRKAAKEFAEYWKDRGYEKGETQPFWLSLLRKVFNIAEPEKYIAFEDSVQLGHKSFIDAKIKATHVLIEQKSSGKDLEKPEKQSDGEMLTPYQQCKRYSDELPYEERARWIITCNFTEFKIYDMNKPHEDPQVLVLKDLPKEYYRLEFLIDTGNVNIKKEMEVSMQAGELVGLLYDALLKEYKDPENPESLKSLNKLCVRIVFCLFAEDAGLFGSHTQFHDYLNGFRGKNVRKALKELFKWLDTKPEERDDYDEDLAPFPYVNGGLFEDEDIEIPNFTDSILDIILHKASEDFDWSVISPTIFGAIFESTLNPETRRAGGMHYTSVENIHKVIDPLFFNDLKSELAEIKNEKIAKDKKTKLDKYQDKLAKLNIFDPACGSGNFLTESYLSLRRLENEAIKELVVFEGAGFYKKGTMKGEGQLEGQVMIGGDGAKVFNPIKVSIGQMYGIELNDFAVTVARTALWIAESQMMKATEDIVNMPLDFLPLKSYTNIHEGNALRMDWTDVISKQRCNYIIGNPPFLGYSLQSVTQKEEMYDIFDGNKKAGRLDYVCGWYAKATEFINGFNIDCAFVSTNSITQGEQVPILWEKLLKNNVKINFAYPTFVWNNSAKDEAHVHCVILGFSIKKEYEKKYLYFKERKIQMSNINPYLIDAPNTIIKSSGKPISNIPTADLGNRPIDDGNFLFTKEEKNDFIKQEPDAASLFRPWIGAKEFINCYERYFLWLRECSPSELRKMPKCLERIEAVKAFRHKSKAIGTLKIADTPLTFYVEHIPNTNSIIIPRVSSQNRKYIPIGFLGSDVLISDSAYLVSNATIYHFGVLTSNVHNSWTRMFAGRLKSDIRYSTNIVYNTFPWPDPTPEQKSKIEKTAQAILDTRSKYPDSSLADLYDPLTMPPDLLRAHKDNNKAVCEAYGPIYKEWKSEADCVAYLMRRYKELTEEK